MTCCAERRPSPTLFLAVVALSAAAFFGQAFETPAAGAIALAARPSTSVTVR